MNSVHLIEFSSEIKPNFNSYFRSVLSISVLIFVFVHDNNTCENTTGTLLSVFGAILS